MRLRPSLAILFLLAATAHADGPADNKPENVRQVPKPGIKVPEAAKKDLEAGLDDLKAKLDALARSGSAATGAAAFIPDVRIFERAVRGALVHDEFFSPAEIGAARGLIEKGLDRHSQIVRDSTLKIEPGTSTALGYVSKIDGSIQPYGLVVPASYSPVGKQKYRLDLWFHGRNEDLSEVNFLRRVGPKFGEFTPPDTFVLQPYGRFCNAFKFAGEIDVLEAIEDVKKRFPIDDDRISVRGFSMGGAAVWHMAVHYADRWFAANPGAGFSETPRFLHIFQNEKLQPAWYEKTLWHLYDCNEVAVNLLQCPTVAYSGEIDPQKQAADVMAEALKAEGMELTHIIGPKTQHKYEPNAKKEVEARMEALAKMGRDDRPISISMATYTLKYNRMNWLTIDALDRHWERAEVRVLGHNDPDVVIETRNVKALTIDVEPGMVQVPSYRADYIQPPIDQPDARVKIALQRRGAVRIQIDGEFLTGPLPQSDRSSRFQLHREGDKWVAGPLPGDGLRKKHGLQGPIDDAFLDSFVFVRPTGPSSHPKVAEWAKSEQERAVSRWRRQFRGDARVVDDSKLSDADIDGANLVLWGDPESNSVLKKIADKLPIRWSAEAIAAGERTFPAEDHALIAIYPNPLNPARYVVLNSGFTYREYDDLNNARQVPRLPDWAIVDLKTPPDARFPGKVVAADFFGESWELTPPRP